jgi:hypothetical protein
LKMVIFLKEAHIKSCLKTEAFTINCIRNSFLKKNWKEKYNGEGFFEIHEEEELGKLYDVSLMKRLLSYSRKYFRYFLFAWVLLICVTASSLIRPYLLRIAIDDHLSLFVFNKTASEIPDKAVHIKSVVNIGLIYTGLILAAFIMNYFQMLLLSYGRSEHNIQYT